MLDKAGNGPTGRKLCRARRYLQAYSEVERSPISPETITRPGFDHLPNDHSLAVFYLYPRRGAMVFTGVCIV